MAVFLVATRVAPCWVGDNLDLGLHRAARKHFPSNERSWGSEGVGKPTTLSSQPLCSQDWGTSGFLLGAVPFFSSSVLSLLKKRMGWVLQLGLARDPFLYTLFVVETNLAICRSFLGRDSEYFNNLVLEDQGHYYFLVRRASRRPFSQIALFPGVWPSTLQRREKSQVVPRQGTVASFLEDPTDLEFHIKWLFCQDMGLTLDTVIDRKDVCRCRASSAVTQELELFVSVQSTEHLLESVAFAVRYYLFVKYLLLIAQVVLKVGM